MLEPYEGKLSRTVLRGEGGSNALDLPDEPSPQVEQITKFKRLASPTLSFVKPSAWYPDRRDGY